MTLVYVVGTNGNGHVDGACTSHHHFFVQNRHFCASARFSALHYWNLQTPPTSSDKVAQAFAWIDLAEAVSLFDMRVRIVNCPKLQLHASVPVENTAHQHNKQP